MKSMKYPDDSIRACGLKNDAELCRYMGWSHGVAHDYRNGIRFMDDEKCLQVT